MSNVYTSHGYKNRKDYLISVAEDYGLPYNTVYTIASMFGENEDFDGLISELDDYIDMFDID